MNATSGTGHWHEDVLLREFAVHVEELALRGAGDDPRPDKSDWIRVWAAARRYQARPAGPADWNEATRGHQEAAQDHGRAH